MKSEKEIEVFVGDPIVLAQKNQRLDDFASELDLEHTMADYGVVDYKLPTISGPDSTQWEFIVENI